MAASVFVAALLPALAIPAAPANDPFNAPIILIGSSVDVAGSNVSATKEPGEPNHAGDPGGKSVWWRWTAPANGTAEFSTLASGFDTLLAIYSGNSVTNLAVIAANDQDASGGDTSRANFAATQGSVYRIAVDGYAGESGAVQLQWQFQPGPPVLANPRRTVAGFEFDITGAPELPCVLETSATLAPAIWIPIATNTLPANGVWPVTYSVANGTGARFYRARQ